MAYRVHSYGRMIRDRVRMDAYAAALRRAVRPGCVVLDIGTGTGIFAMLACQMGARKVYAVEPNDAIHVARQIAHANGLADRIEFIQALSTDITLPEQADVIVSDLRGVMPLYDTHIPSIVDARSRFLAPDGVLIPQRDTLWAAPVTAPDTYRDFAAPWDDRPFGFNMTPARENTMNLWTKAVMAPEQMLSDPIAWATLDYTRIVEPDISAELTWTVTHAEVGHGISVWFDTLLVNGIGFTTAPGQPETVYGASFFPWADPVALTTGDRVSVSFWARLTGGQYVWHWHTRVDAAEQPARPKAQFTQSTALGAYLSAAQFADALLPEKSHD